MMVLTVNNLPAATHGETVRCLFAIELSGMSWVVAFNTPLSEKISRRTLIGCKWKKLLELIEDGARDWRRKRTPSDNWCGRVSAVRRVGRSK
jgi:hypothetical protein